MPGELDPASVVLAPLQAIPRNWSLAIFLARIWSLVQAMQQAGAGTPHLSAQLSPAWKDGHTFRRGRDQDY
jgi:hypothetical protein